jgi:hypothetical protein
MEESPRMADPGLSRRGLLKSSLLIGLGAAGLSATSTAVNADAARASQNANILLAADYGTELTTGVQTQWAYCGACRNLWYAGEGSSSEGICAAGYGGHGTGSTTDYGVIIDNPGFSATPPSGDNAYLQSPWLWCANCACLFWGNGQAQSWCAFNLTNGGRQFPHVSTGSGVYYMPYGVELGGGAAWTAFRYANLQPGWKYCSACKCLYWGGEEAVSVCQYYEARGQYPHPHNSGDSVYYVAMMTSATAD